MQIKKSLESKFFLFLFCGIIFFLINTNIVYAPGECYCDSLKPCNSGYYWITGAGCCCGGFPPIWPGTCCCKSSGLTCSLSVSSTEVNVGKSFSVTASAQVSEGLIGSASVDVKWTGGGIFGGGAYTNIVSSGGSGDCGYDSYIFPYYSGEGNFECEDEKDRTVSITASTLGGVTCSKVIVVHCNKPCICSTWTTSDDDCDDAHCSNSCQKYYTRNCNPAGCDDEEDCKTPSYGSCVYENECSTTGSQSNACGCTNPCTRTVSLPYASDNNEKINGEEIYCSDTLDNDCDTLIDYEDPDCALGVNGTVKNAFGNPIDGAEVTILGLSLSDTTDANGNYFIYGFDPGTYDIAASKQGFEPGYTTFYFDDTIVTVNFTLYTAGSDCRPDCSKTNDEIPVCHMDCEGINGCHFYDNTLRGICTRNGEMIGVPVGNTVSYNSTHKATCCEGSPYLYKKTPGTSLVFPEVETIVRITRIVFFRGQFARMIIDVFK